MGYQSRRVGRASRRYAHAGRSVYDPSRWPCRHAKDARPYGEGRKELEKSFPLYGYSPDEIREAAIYQTLYFDAMRSDAAYEKLQAAYEQARARGARWVWDPGTKERLQQQWFRLIMDFDPVPTLEKVKSPVLAFFGEKDVLVPPDGNVAIMEQ